MSDAQCEAVRAFVRRGGGLIASHETSLHDETGRRRPDFGLEDVLGVTVRGRRQLPDGASLKAAAGTPLTIPVGGIPIHEDVVAVVPDRQATVAAWISAPGGMRKLPGAILSTFGKGCVVYFPGRQDAEYVFHEGLQHFPALISSAVRNAAPDGSIPACIAEPTAHVGLTCFDQPSRNRRILHLVAYNAAWKESFDRLPPIPDVRLRIGIPEGRRVAGVRAVRLDRELVPTLDGVLNATVTLPVLNEYEVLVVAWK